MIMWPVIGRDGHVETTKHLRTDKTFEVTEFFSLSSICYPVEELHFWSLPQGLHWNAPHNTAITSNVPAPSIYTEAELPPRGCLHRSIFRQWRSCVAFTFATTDASDNYSTPRVVFADIISNSPYTANSPTVLLLASTCIYLRLSQKLEPFAQTISILVQPLLGVVL